MSDGAITPLMAIQQLSQVSRQLDLLGERIKDVERKAVTAEHTYRVEKAKALLTQTDGTVSEREARALLEVADIRLKAKLAAAEWSIMKREIQICESRIGVGRTVTTVLRAEAAL